MVVASLKAPAAAVSMRLQLSLLLLLLVGPLGHPAPALCNHLRTPSPATKRNSTAGTAAAAAAAKPRPGAGQYLSYTGNGRWYTKMTVPPSDSKETKEYTFLFNAFLHGKARLSLSSDYSTYPRPSSSSYVAPKWRVTRRGSSLVLGSRGRTYSGQHATSSTYLSDLDGRTTYEIVVSASSSFRITAYQKRTSPLESAVVALGAFGVVAIVLFLISCCTLRKRKPVATATLLRYRSYDRCGLITGIVIMVLCVCATVIGLLASAGAVVVIALVCFTFTLLISGGHTVEVDTNKRTIAVRSHWAFVLSCKCCSRDAVPMSDVLAVCHTTGGLCCTDRSRGQLRVSRVSGSPAVKLPGSVRDPAAQAAVIQAMVVAATPAVDRTSAPAAAMGAAQPTVTAAVARPLTFDRTGGSMLHNTFDMCMPASSMPHLGNHGHSMEFATEAALASEIAAARSRYEHLLGILRARRLRASAGTHSGDAAAAVHVTVRAPPAFQMSAGASALALGAASVHLHRGAATGGVVVGTPIETPPVMAQLVSVEDVERGQAFV